MTESRKYLETVLKLPHTIRDDKEVEEEAKKLLHSIPK